MATYYESGTGNQINTLKSPIINPNATYTESGTGLQLLGSRLQGMLPSAIPVNTLQTTPIALPNTPVNTTNYAGMFGGTNAMIAANAMGLSQPTGTSDPNSLEALMAKWAVPVPSSVDTRAQVYGANNETLAPYQNDANAASSAYNSATQKYQGLDAQMQQYNYNASTLIPQSVSQSYEGRLATGGGASAITLGELRKNALAAAPVQQQMLSAQREQAIALNNVNQANAILKQQQDHLDTIFTDYMNDANAQYTYKTNALGAITDYLTAKETREANTLATKLKQEHDDQLTNLSNANDWAKTANASGQSDIASQILKKIQADPSADISGLVAQIKPDELKQLQIQQAGLNVKKTQTEIAQLNDPSLTDPIVTDPQSSSILAQTGLSMPAFAYLTQGTSALTRMTAAMRKQYMQEAADWANKNNIDISTFQSQYGALSKTVGANLLRNNQASVAEAELAATVKNLTSAASEAGLKDLKGLNIAKIWAGQQLNSANATTYKFHLEQLRNEFALYNAALSGQLDVNGNVREINDADKKRADEIIQQGFAAGSLDGFSTALNASLSKMGVVLQSSINAQNKQVWKLFGVGDKYDATAGTTTGNTSGSGALSPQIDSALTSSAKVDDGAKTVTVPRSVWSTFGAEMDNVIAAIAAKGYKLLVGD